MIIRRNCGKGLEWSINFFDAIQVQRLFCGENNLKSETMWEMKLG